MKQADATLMVQEARETADVVERQLARNAEPIAELADRWRRHPPRCIVTAARGSSDHAASYAKYVFETRLGVVTASASPSVASIYGAPQQLSGALYLVLSQSGASPDLLCSAQAAKDAGAHVVALLNVEQSPLADIADAVIPLCAGPERSVAATKSCLATLAAVLQLTAVWSGDVALLSALARLPDDLRRGWDADWSTLAQGLIPAEHLFVVGRGYGYGAALEAALKLKETCGLHAEAVSAAEVRHGPMALVGRGFPVLFFAQDDGTLAGTLAVADDFRRRGAQVWVAAPEDAVGASGAMSRSTSGTMSDSPGGVLPLAAGVSPLIAPLLAVQSFYRAAATLALARGHDPDVPKHLAKVTETV